MIVGSGFLGFRKSVGNCAEDVVRVRDIVRKFYDHERGTATTVSVKGNNFHAKSETFTVGVGTIGPLVLAHSLLAFPGALPEERQCPPFPGATIPSIR